MLLPALAVPPDGPEIGVRDRLLDYATLARAATTLAARLPRDGRVAVVAERELETVVAVVAGLIAGTAVVPVNPAATPRELDHQLGDADPVGVLHPAAMRPPDGIPSERTVPVDLDELLGAPAGPTDSWSEPPPGSPALVMYTSGTTGPPKGVVLSRAAVAANLDALAEAWAWTAADRLVHALPLYHVHGLVLGVLGPLRLGGSLHHLGSFDPATTAAALRAGGTVHFGVPTIYHRLADAAEDDDELADAVIAGLKGARLLVSGSAGLPASVHERIRVRTGQVVVERYGMTETMITTAVPAGSTSGIGTVGPPLRDVSVRLVDERGAPVPADGTSMGELLVRTPSLFSGYLHRPDATAAAFRDGWFATGDVATIDGAGYVRIVGRDSTDIIKSGGYKIGAGEIEDVLLEHPAVAEAAVAGVPDEEWGEQVAAWVVAAEGDLSIDDLRAHVAQRLAPHKQPRRLTVVASLPRNGLGKIQKHRLVAPTTPDR